MRNCVGCKDKAVIKVHIMCNHTGSPPWPHSDLPAHWQEPPKLPHLPPNPLSCWRRTFGVPSAPKRHLEKCEVFWWCDPGVLFWPSEWPWWHMSTSVFLKKTPKGTCCMDGLFCPHTTIVMTDQCRTGCSSLQLWVLGFLEAALKHTLGCCVITAIISEQDLHPS